jgi:valyl-tRNA synthetase
MSSNVDVAAEKDRLSKELEYAKGFLASVMKKLGNEKFMNSAPAAVVEGENKKRSDAESMIKMLEEKIQANFKYAKSTRSPEFYRRGALGRARQ